MQRWQITVAVEFIYPSSPCFCTRLLCSVLTPGHPLTAPLGSPPACCVLPGRPQQPHSPGFSCLGRPDPWIPLSSSAALHSLRAVAGLRTTPFLRSVPGSPCSSAQPWPLSQGLQFCPLCSVPCASGFCVCVCFRLHWGNPRLSPASGKLGRSGRKFAGEGPLVRFCVWWSSPPFLPCRRSGNAQRVPEGFQAGLSQPYKADKPSLGL